MHHALGADQIAAQVERAQRAAGVEARLHVGVGSAGRDVVGEFAPSRQVVRVCGAPEAPALKVTGSAQRTA